MLFDKFNDANEGISKKIEGNVVRLLFSKINSDNLLSVLGEKKLELSMIVN